VCRLGHKEQKDEWTPRVVETFQRANVLPPNALVAAGSAYSAATAAGGQLYMWGRVKTTGDNWMYPKPVLDLSGWSIRSLDCGNTTSLAAAEESCISWGTALYGELGYGPTGPKYGHHIIFSFLSLFCWILN
jgi:alpha-tubulin suppressor-like RCC1 family protein